MRSSRQPAALLPVLEAVVQTGKPFCHHRRRRVEGEALATLVVNKLRGGLKVAAVKAPGFGDAARPCSEDIAILANGSGDQRRTRHQARERVVDMLGRAKRVRIEKRKHHHHRWRGQEEESEGRVPRSRHRSGDHVDYDKEKLQERLAKLAGGVAVIKVGGATEVEVKERKDRVDDALNATRAAVEEGIVAGGGVSLLRAAQTITVKGENEDQNAGIAIVRRALQAPIRQIAENAGVEGSIVVGKVLDRQGSSYGYDAQNDQYGDLFGRASSTPPQVVRHGSAGSASMPG